MYAQIYCCLVETEYYLAISTVKEYEKYIYVKNYVP